ncbi:MAG TPA: alanine racemase [Dehalococcoidia bacterium]|nr:alanine racemase [Dehalococcoidia bacterium]
MKLHEIDTPALVVDLDVMERNMAAIARTLRERGVAWRPHAKCHKSPAIARKLIDEAGAIGVTCQKLGEAEVMADAGIDHILVANEVVGETKLRRLIALRQRGVDVTVALDDAAVLDRYREAARETGVSIPVVVEVNIGQDRCGVEPGDEAVALAKRAAATEGVEFRGLMGWEGHVMHYDDPAVIAREATEAVQRLLDSAAACRAAGVPVQWVSCGGTCDYHIVSALPGVTEIQAGSGIFSDVFYRQRGVPLEPALTLLATVVSRRPDRAIVDAGFKALGPPFLRPQPLIEGVERLDIGSAEHGTLKLASPEAPIRVGDKVRFIVGYTDMTVFLHDRIYGVRGDEVEQVLEVTARRLT